jgi:flagella basal body P-ring formation protein FlgA
MTRALALAVLLAVPLAAAAPACAQVAGAPRSDVPTLKRAVTVSGAIVRIRDLVDNAGAAGDAPIFRSPDVGTTGAVSVETVLAALRPHHLFLVDTRDLTEIEVARDGRLITLKDIEARIARAFTGQYGLGDVKDMVITLDAASRPITIDASSGDLQLLRAAFDPRSGRFDVAFDMPGGASMRRTPMRYTGTLVDTAEAVLLTRALARNDMIKASDLAVERRPKAELGGELVGSIDQAAGLVARAPLRAGQPLRRTDLMKPEMVRRDETVTLIYEVPGIVLTTRGKAIDAGAEGDVVSVLNIQSKRTVQGVVSGPGRVTIAATAPRPQTAAVPQTLASRLIPAVR